MGFVWGFVSVIIGKNEYFYRKIVPGFLLIYTLVVIDMTIFGFNFTLLFDVAPFIIGMVIGGVLGKILLRQNL